LRRDKLGSNEWLNGYELRFGSGLNPNGSDACLLGRIHGNRFVERVRTQRSDRSAAAGVLRLGWASYWAARPIAGSPGGLARLSQWVG
jgi:hypothetical protein